MAPPLLEVVDLSVRFPNSERSALDGVSFSIGRGERVALVGESGAGKTTAALSILRLTGPGTIRSGTVRLSGEDLGQLSEQDMSRLRGRKIGVVFQDPRAAVNPVLTIGSQLSEVLKVHTGLSGRALHTRALEWLERAGFSETERAYSLYAHEMSGGMLQRAVIALALAGEPKLVIADEPTTALDTTLQAEVLGLLSTLVSERSMGLLLITHDLGVVAQFSERVLVLYAGQIVESADVDDLFHHPAHPYTRGLLASLPGEQERGKRLPLFLHVPERAQPGACPFAEACPDFVERCRSAPGFERVKEGHVARCWFANSARP